MNRSHRRFAAGFSAFVLAAGYGAQALAQPAAPSPAPAPAATPTAVQPLTPEQAEKAAGALYDAKDFGAAYEAYDSLLKNPKLTKPKKDLFEKRKKELNEKTGALQIDVNETGAEVFVDEKSVGISPLPFPRRVTVGPHTVRVSKQGFLPFSQAPNVVAASNTVFSVQLAQDGRKGRVSVKEKNGKAMRVFVDGVDMGAAPWAGDVEPGSHDIQLKSGAAASAPNRVTVARGETSEVVLEASSTTAPIKVVVSDAKGLIFLDDKLLGEGAFTAEVPAGPHKLKVTRDGYDTFEEDILIKEKEPYSKTVTLRLSQVISTGKVQGEEDRLEGFYGGVGVMAVFMPSGNGNSFEQRCDEGATGISCKDSSVFGGGLAGYVGYQWDPVGIELFMTGQYDTTSPEIDFQKSLLNLNADPARTEKLSIHRAGGSADLRARYVLQSKRVRGSFAAGAGLAYRALVAERDANTPDGYKAISIYDPVSYVAPHLSLQLQGGFRATKSIAIVLGGLLMFEHPNAWSKDDKAPEAPQDTSAVLVKDDKTVPIPISTPTYQLATGVQTFMGLFLGVEFGP